MSNKKKVRILSLDGGGIRGIIPAYILKYVEEYLAVKAPGTNLADHFDLISGTSTGGILTCIYLTPDDKDKTKAKFSAKEALGFYEDNGFDIFNRSKISGWKTLWGLKDATKYSPKTIEKLFHKYFGNIKMSELRKPCIVTTYNMRNKSSFFFSSQENKEKREFLVQDVTRSTSAAPTYFPPAKITNLAPGAGKDGEPLHMINLDGGVFANNPVMCAYAEARQSNFEERNNDKPSASDMYILSLGTGGGGFTLKGKENSNKWNLLKWAKSIPEIMMDGSVDTVAYQMKEIFGTLADEHKKNYMRIDVDPADRKIYSSDMSNASPQNINDLLIAGKNTLERAKKNGLDKFLDGLIDETNNQ